MFNYENIGGKLKGLAKAVFIIEAIIGIISGLGMAASDNDLILVGLLVMILVPLIAWISSWLLYGFGELIEKASAIERNTRGGEKKPESQVNRTTRLKNLLSEGLITEEEYQKAIAKGE